MSPCDWCSLLLVESELEARSSWLLSQLAWLRHAGSVDSAALFIYRLCALRVTRGVLPMTAPPGHEGRNRTWSRSHTAASSCRCAGVPCRGFQPPRWHPGSPLVFSASHACRGQRKPRGRPGHFRNGGPEVSGEVPRITRTNWQNVGINAKSSTLGY